MVRVIWITAMTLAVAAPASAQDVDWRRAGGGLFGTPVVEPAVADALDGATVPRLASLNQPFQDAIDAAAVAHGLDPKLLHALVITESAYRADARSPVGAGGLTQLMPGTALELGVRDRFDPVENLRGGADYLARQILRFGDLRLALAAYNSGPGRVARLGRIPDIAETQAYVASVVDCYLALTAGQGVTNSRQCRPRGAGR
ncbi:MAG: lytic transglycosylase domain-containing protein [Brevundimonas sp.]|uniref:lytic transglycosylase domain-containing protein n=1 Tax=Brevundimonas sp. TaxID=1871086 RepID=UPI002725B61A|nr:lytic transglycosylase domain-containing protein [Brevundimonas sp.]MDO9077088.1 lytic transglycosylase domain-containing protein [Brevundimonas sp.]MDP3080171.1 lytic transglycosylase domain-containing protein [Brevundimonas sp.]MDZ4059769.1 lytic transglycosylase domain-containing protein [Brevundimonas sp.]